MGRAQAKIGRSDEGLATLDEALAFVQKSGEGYYEAELHRLRGTLLLAQGDEGGAEASFRKAVEVARRQKAKSWELRATVSLSRLWRRQGNGQRAGRWLEEIYSWFTEGFETPDLVEARDLLEELPRE